MEFKKPEVLLLPYSPLESEILESIYVAAKGCYSGKSAYELALISEHEDSEDKKWALFKRLWKDQHRTTLTHMNFSFSFDYVPIKIATQLTRKQVGVTFDQRSTRYLPKWTAGSRAFDYGVLPIRFREQDKEKYSDGAFLKLQKMFENCYNMCAQTYEAMRAEGVPAEDASYILNLGAYTGLTATFNLVSFRDWIAKRLEHSTGKAQGEHEELAELALQCFKENYPKFAEIMFSV